MSELTLDQLRASERRLIAALGDPSKAIFYDDFKRENRPISEIQDALRALRAEIDRATGQGSGSTLKVRKVRLESDY